MSTQPAVKRLTADERRQANRAVAVSAIGLGATGLVELLLALVTGSVGLLGDAIHNLSDVSTSAVVFLGFRLSRRPPTEKYPYGLERAEDLAREIPCLRREGQRSDDRELDADVANRPGGVVRHRRVDDALADPRDRERQHRRCERRYREHAEERPPAEDRKGRGQRAHKRQER